MGRDVMMGDWHYPGSRLQKCGVVLPRGRADEWDGGMVESPVVWYDSRLSTYVMVYTGYGRRGDASSGDYGYDTVTGPQIGMATSDDLLNWTKSEHNPILTPSGAGGAPDSHGVTGPFVLPPAISGLDEYYMFYFGTTDRGYEAGTKTLNVTTSKDLVNWTRYANNPVIEPDSSGPLTEWRNEAIWHPNVVREADTFYLFFNTSGIHDGLHEEFIGYAWSKNLLDWVVDDENCPLLTGSREPGAWDAAGRAGDPSVFLLGDRWYMAYYSWDGERTQDGMASTSREEFPLGWVPYEHNPVLRFGQAGSYDAQHAGKPFVIRTESIHHHFYTAVAEDGTREIALATEPADQS